MDRIRQLARKWGTRIWKRDCRDYAFNGKTIAEFQDEALTKRRTESNLIHDIAHFVVAAPERKAIPEFGLGDSPDTKRCDTPLSKGMTYDKAQYEEELASALGIYWEREFGLDWRDTFEEHRWDDIFMSMPKEEHKIFDFDAKHKFAKQLRELRKRQII